MASYVQLGPGAGSSFVSARPWRRRGERRPVALLALITAILAAGLWLGANVDNGPPRIAASTFIAASPP